jgi:hypothetical protein
MVHISAQKAVSNMSISSEKLRGFVHSVNEKIILLFKKMETFSTKRIYLLLFFLTFIMAAPMLIAYEIDDDDGRYEHKDLDIFKDRAETILEGEMLYRDTEHVTLSPPLINYLFVPAVLLGNTPLIWTAWFAVFIFSSSVILYHILNSFFEKQYSLAGSIFFIASPFSQYTSIIMMQDDTIIASVLLLAFLFIIQKSWYKASAVFGFGAMTKLFPALCAPLAAVGPRTWKERFIATSIGLGIGIIIALPYLLWATEEFLQFLNFYLTGKQPIDDTQLSVIVSDIDQRGMSFWRFLGEGVVYIPSIYLHAVFVTFILTTWVAALMKKIEFIPAFTLCILLIFIFYSKIHYGYHLMIFSLLIPWALPHPRQLTALGFMSFFLIIIHKMWRKNSIYYTSSAIQLMFASVMWAFWVYWAVILLKNRKSEFSRPESCTDSTILVVSYFTLICAGYYFLLGIKILL